MTYLHWLEFRVAKKYYGTIRTWYFLLIHILPIRVSIKPFQCANMRARTLLWFSPFSWTARINNSSSAIFILALVMWVSFDSPAYRGTHSNVNTLGALPYWLSHDWCTLVDTDQNTAHWKPSERDQLVITPALVPVWWYYYECRKFQERMHKGTITLHKSITRQLELSTHNNYHNCTRLASIARILNIHVYWWPANRAVLGSKVNEFGGLFSGCGSEVQNKKIESWVFNEP